MKTLATAAAAAGLALAAAACSSATAPRPAATAVRPVAASASPTPSAVAAVPGTSNNQYVTGPFTVTLKGIAALPTQYDAVSQSGQVIPKNCAEVTVTNTSSSFTGWVAPDVEFVKGHSVRGQVLDTEHADPSGGSSGGESDPLSPGQSQTLWSCPQGVTSATYVESQLTSVSYGTPSQGTAEGTTVQLKY